MDLKNLMAQAQKMQKDLETKLAAYDATEFNLKYKEMVEIKIMGSLEIKSITFLDDSIIDKNDKETLEAIITKATSEAVSSVLEGKKELTSKIAGPQLGGLM